MFRGRASGGASFSIHLHTKSKCGRGRGREGEREIECRERWGNCVVHLYSMGVKLAL